jgi:hypothetical protein
MLPVHVHRWCGRPSAVASLRCVTGRDGSIVNDMQQFDVSRVAIKNTALEIIRTAMKIMVVGSMFEMR